MPTSVPTLPAVVDALLSPATSLPGASVNELARDGRDVGHALRRLVTGDLAGLFDGPSTIDFDPSLPMISLDLSGVQGSNQLLAMVMTCASAWMEAALSDADGGQRWVIYDEAWRLMRQPALLARMQSQWKLSRGLGIANLLIVHRLSDLEAVGDADSEARALARGLLADCSTKVIYQQEISESPHTARELGLSVAERAQLPDLQRGEGLWRVGQRAFVVRHIATPRELSLFDTNARMQAPPVGRSATGAAPRPRCAAPLPSVDFVSQLLGGDMQASTGGDGWIAKAVLGLAVLWAQLWVSASICAWLSGHTAPRPALVPPFATLWHIADPSAPWGRPIGPPWLYWAISATLLVATVGVLALLLWWRKGGTAFAGDKVDGVARRSEVARAAGPTPQLHGVAAALPDAPASRRPRSPDRARPWRRRLRVHRGLGRGRRATPVRQGAPPRHPDDSRLPGRRPHHEHAPGQPHRDDASP